MEKLDLAIREVLQASTLFNALTPEESEGLAKNSRLCRVARGEVIWTHGAEVDFFGIVGTGFVKMVKGVSSGADVTLEIMGPGQIFGLMGTLDRQGCPLTAIAISKAIYLRVPKREIHPIYERNLVLKNGLLMRLSRRFKQNLDMMARMGSGRVDERIGAVLFILADSYGEEDGDTVKLTIPLTRQEIGEMAGTTTESTIRTLSRWQKEGIVSTDKHLITITDVPALVAIVGK
ncbi:MAG: Crp/Fnr family transcriptional regulator [Fimbriimonadaceae bacterium]|nr:Crp/Fnr family transcriptional regulator [Fimbriimonadaceae bacterium]